MVFSVLADIVVFIHLLWIVFLVIGAFPGVRYRTVKVIHIAGLAFSFIIQIAGWYCPLTYLEIWLRSLHDPAHSYAGSFISHYIEKIVYLEVSRLTVFVLTVLLIIINIWIYRKGEKSSRVHTGGGHGAESMKFLKRYISLIDMLNAKIGALVSWLTGAMVIVVSYDVITRYVLRQSSVAVHEIEWHLFALIFLLGAAYTLSHDKHVRIDVFYAKLSKRGKALVDLTGSLLFLIPFAVLVIWTSRDFVMNSFAIGESSPDPGGLPARYILKACIPVSFFLLFLQGTAIACKSLLELKSGKASNRERMDG